MGSNRFAPTGAAALLTSEGFAVWALFALLPLAAGGTVREAWDTGGYWVIGMPVLLISLGLAGAMAEQSPWKLAAWALFGHAVAMIAFAKPGSDLGMLPLAIAFIGLPMFAAFSGAAWQALLLRRPPRPAARHAAAFMARACPFSRKTSFGF